MTSNKNATQREIEMRRENSNQLRLIDEGYTAFMNKESIFSCPHQGDKLTLWLKGYNKATLSFY